uniref:ATP-binding protein n=1 Tax=Muribaculaceae bacterium Z82 TaxID=2304548 RepID=A0A7C9JE13_9BACT
MITDALIPRPDYEKLLDRYTDTDFVKVLKGIRRCGKSALLDLHIARLAERGVPARNLIRRRFDEFDFALGVTAEELQADLAEALSRADERFTAYVFLDEIQMVPRWERIGRGLQTRPRTDVYITGSNAYLLSSDLATYLSGRYVELDVFPLSFREYLDFCEATDRSSADVERRFAEYLRYGGMPSLFAFPDPAQDDIARELSGIYNTVVLNDVAKRFSIRDFSLLDRLVAYVFSTSGNLFSTRSIANYLKSSGSKASPDTVEGYLYALQQALIVHGVPQEGLQGKDILRPLRKFYPVDTGLRNLPSGFVVRDTGFQLENVVYVELLRRGFAVSVGSVTGKEVDFIARKGAEVLYVQVCESVADDAVLDRELAPLRALEDSFPKLLLIADRLRTGTTSDGIRIANLIDWLLAA